MSSIEASLRLSYAKDETTLKLVILSIAAITGVFLYLLPLFCSQFCFISAIWLILSYLQFVQPLPVVCSLLYGLRVSFMSLIRISIIVRRGIWLNRFVHFNIYFYVIHLLLLQGFYSFHNWFDDRAWYPLGRIIGGTIYPGLFCLFVFLKYSVYYSFHIVYS